MNERELPKYYKSQSPRGAEFSEVKNLIEIIMSPLILYKYKISQKRKVKSMKNTRRLLNYIEWLKYQKTTTRRVAREFHK